MLQPGKLEVQTVQEDSHWPGWATGLEWPHFMNKILSPGILSFLVGASAMACVILCLMHIQYSRRIRSIHGTQMQLQAIQRNQQMINALASELYAYGKTNAAMMPLLNSVGFKVNKP